jgi:dynein heavy chain
VQENLDVIQPKFRENLLQSVEAFQDETEKFDGDYAYNGPMVDGITPSQASERLQVFQSRFDGVFRKFITYSSGEDLFGL